MMLMDTLTTWRMCRTDRDKATFELIMSLIPELKALLRNQDTSYFELISRLLRNVDVLQTPG